MTENEFLLADRIQKIKSMNELYNLEENAYISYSGGKDSTVLSHLIDEALPDNKIPRVYFNTGIEYLMIVSFVERERKRQSHPDCSTKEEHQSGATRKWLSVQKQGTQFVSFSFSEQWNDKKCYKISESKRQQICLSTKTSLSIQ